MNFFIEEKTLENEMLKVEIGLITEFAVSLTTIYESESSFTDTIKRFAEKAKIMLKKAIQAIKNFISDALVKVRVRFQQLSIQTKLMDIKTILAKKKSQLNHKRVNIVAVARYKKYYADFINTYTKELITGLNKEFNSVEEYKKWQEGVIAKLDAFSFSLTDEEKWKLTTSVSQAVELSEKEMNNREDLMAMLGAESTDAIKTIEGYYRDAAQIGAFSNPKVGEAVFKLKDSFIGAVVSKIASCVRKAVKFVATHLFQSIAAIAAAIIIF